MKYDQYDFNSFPEDVKLRIENKRQYTRRLNDLLEDIKSAALGIDYYTKADLKQLEKKVIHKLHETELEIIDIVSKYQSEYKNAHQGKLF